MSQSLNIYPEHIGAPNYQLSSSGLWKANGDSSANNALAISQSKCLVHEYAATAIDKHGSYIRSFQSGVKLSQLIGNLFSTFIVSVTTWFRLRLDVKYCRLLLLDNPHILCLPETPNLILLAYQLCVIEPLGFEIVHALFEQFQYPYS